MAVAFHPLTVSSVASLTDDSVVVTFEIPEELGETFRFIPGQHLTLRRTINGEDVRRSYSICSPSGSASLQVGIKKLEGGTFSTWANDQLSAGMSLESTPPAGEFLLEAEPGRAGVYVAIAAGSGITPVLSIIASTLRDEPNSRFTLIFGNRNGTSVMFLDEIDAIKGRYPDRFSVFHILSRESQPVPLLSGRLDAEKLSELFRTVVSPRAVDGWYLCGPRGMVEGARAVLSSLATDPNRIHDELFYAGGDGPVEAAVDDAIGSQVRFTLDGRTSSVIVDPDGAPILDHVLSVRPEGPFSCRSGACASCRAQVTAGEVRMDRNWSLNQAEVDAGQVLTCQSHPVSEVVELTYDV
ncbi:MAG: 2Fe-2S iron-sulfur cluster-binding protein [Acidimicrobiia bacterium]